jgi:asparagine synthase (glutamine-hydrolysing)
MLDRNSIKHLAGRLAAMCGICGIVGPAPADREVLARMTRTLEHRGPDDEGLYVETYDAGTSVGLGFRRLAIIDLETGNQPIANEDGSLRVMLNGEIYNYRELRADLVGRGHRFATNSDTEVIVHLYEDLGPRCVERLNGMFAFALWDERERRLLLARDRFGKKPLYYAEVDGCLLFGSELKALLEHPLCPRELDPASLSRYLALEYVPAPHAIFSGVRKLPGGHLLTWQDGRARVERYWDLTFSPERSPRSDDEYADELRERLRAAVRRRLVSDVPLGAFLSGGIDSSSVVAMMAEALPAGAVKTFSIGFAEGSFDESPHARRVAEQFGTDHREHVFTPGDMAEVLPTIADVLDEPLADASILPTYLLSRFTREHVTVALGGDGGDELLAGYPTFFADQVASLYVVPRLLNDRLVRPLADLLPVSTDDFSFDFKLKRFLRGAASREDVRHALWLGAFSPAEQRSLVTHPSGDPYDVHRHLFANAPSQDRVERLIYIYAKTYLEGDVLVKVDRASMACSLEVRAPFLDVELVEFLGRVPARLKQHRLGTKLLLKRALAGILPPGIASRPKKGFGIPVAEWLKGSLRELLQDELSTARIRDQGIFDAAVVERLVSEHMSGRRDHRKQLWTLLVFQLWHRRWIEQRHARPAAVARA